MSKCMHVDCDNDAAEEKTLCPWCFDAVVFIAEPMTLAEYMKRRDEQVRKETARGERKAKRERWQRVE